MVVNWDWVQIRLNLCLAKKKAIPEIVTQIAPTAPATIPAIASLDSFFVSICFCTSDKKMSNNISHIYVAKKKQIKYGKLLG